MMIIMVVAWPGPLNCHNDNPAYDNDQLIFVNDDDDNN